MKRGICCVVFCFIIRLNPAGLQPFGGGTIPMHGKFLPDARLGKYYRRQAFFHNLVFLIHFKCEAVLMVEAIPDRKPNTHTETVSPSEQAEGDQADHPKF